MGEHKIYYLDNRLDPQAQICHYMPFDCFFRMLVSQKHYISFKKNFRDLSERKLPLKCQFKPRLIGEKLTEEEFREDYEKMQERNTLYEKLGQIPSDCWSLNSKEDYLMWRGYANGAGVCIQTSIDDYVDSLQITNLELYCLKMRYRLPSFTTTAEDCLAIKHPCFESEREVRFYFMSEDNYNGNSTGIDVEFDKVKMINTVILSPFMYKNVARELVDYLKTIHGLNAKVSSISLD